MKLVLENNRLKLLNYDGRKIDPYVARTGVFGSDGKQNGQKLPREPDHYRGFSMPPEWSSNYGAPLIMFSRRGNDVGKNFGDTTTIRRFGLRSRRTTKSWIQTGQSYGQLTLMDHQETDDPMILIGQSHAKSNTYLSIKKDKTQTDRLVVRTWQLPEPKSDPLGEELPSAGNQDKNITPVPLHFCKDDFLPAEALLHPASILNATTSQPIFVFWQKAAVSTEINLLAFELKLPFIGDKCIELIKAPTIKNAILLDTVNFGDYDRDGRLDMLKVKLDKPLESKIEFDVFKGLSITPQKSSQPRP
jgi:hypothetical protein